MKQKIFREYDIRGIVGTDLMLDQVYNLGRAIATYMHEHNQNATTLLVGRDGRTHSPSIATDIVRALSDAGFNVVDIGVCHTPLMYFLLHRYPEKFHGGCMITASHNGPAYNGIKISCGKYLISGAQIQQVYQLFSRGVHVQRGQTGVVTCVDYRDEYINYLVAQFPHLINQDIACLFDCGNGATGVIMPMLLKQFNWHKAGLLFQEIDGSYPNHEADPIKYENMKQLAVEVKHNNYDLGIGFDGDGDRMAALTQDGRLLQGDELLMLFSQPVLKANPGAHIVFEVSCSAQLPELIAQQGGQSHMVPIGHSSLKRGIARHGAVLAGEVSCHFFFADRYFGFDDGIYAALRLIDMLFTTKKSLQELVTQLPKTYKLSTLRLVCPEGFAVTIIEGLKKLLEHEHDMTLIEIDGLRAVFSYGWVLIRASNTEPVISLRAEATSPEGFMAITALLSKLLEPYYSPHELERLKCLPEA